MVYRDLSIFSGTAHPELAQAICSYLGVPLGKAEVVKFSNENIFPKINQNVREHDVFVIQPTYPNVSDSILELLIMIDALKRASASRITAVVPYFSYARSDKKDQPRVPITARLVADMLQTAGANRLLTIDLHAGQVQGFFNIPVDELTAMQPLLRDYVIGMEMIDPVVVAGDLGFAKRARNFADMIGASVAFVEKRRLGNNSSSESLGVIGDVRGKSAIIVDDEIDTAGSIVGAAEIVRRAGARAVYAAATHALLTGPAVERLRNSPIEELIVTDTVQMPLRKRLPNMTVLSVSLLFGEAIARIHTGESVGAMFGAPV
ncbi:MAG: ribose-phosphate pyrophosphokinase [Chloroflexi bacterium]|nr:ribose-phosphate pyrophosphokinase [Chloroflexota bacterium]MBV9133264.1 ribose-phosphate pyrophosphokinase [Chloroflexota bacterium]MBV9893973.1 ribose-phosphate pyrophosphokinase [Chloroflexota bacterium]